MRYETKTKAIVALHWLWIFLGLVSLPLVLLNPHAKPWVLAFIGVTVLSWVVWRGCLFIIWENAEHSRHNRTNIYDEAFISHYLKKYFNLNVSTAAVRTLIYAYMAATTLLCFVKI